MKPTTRPEEPAAIRLCSIRAVLVSDRKGGWGLPRTGLNIRKARGFECTCASAANPARNVQCFAVRPPSLVEGQQDRVAVLIWRSIVMLHTNPLDDIGVCSSVHHVANHETKHWLC